MDEIARLRRENVPGASGRLRDLFDYLADRGQGAEPANQADISSAVFGQADPDGDDATVRVYVHRLRKRLEDHYSSSAQNRAVRLEIPAGTYALRFAEAPLAAETPATADPSPGWHRFEGRNWLIPAALLLLLAGLGAGWAMSGRSSLPVNAFWRPFLASERPVLIVLGDYYIYGEIDPLRPEEGRLIRDFRVNSPTDLERMKDLSPQRFSAAEDVGLNYLPFSSAYGLQAVMPMMEAQGKQVDIIAASQLEPDMLNRADIVYVGLMSGMGLLEELSFMGSGFAVGETYDELVDIDTGDRFISGEARTLPSQAYYRDYAYLARFRAPSGALVAVLGGSRDTGLRALSAIMMRADLPDGLADAASDEAFEALYEITGQQGTDVSERLLVARARTDAAP